MSIFHCVCCDIDFDSDFHELHKIDDCDVCEECFEEQRITGGLE